MGKRKKVVLDTNVYVSAFGWGGKPDDCFQLVIDDEVQNYVSPKLLDEVSDVLEYPKFDFSDDQKARTVRIIVLESNVVEPNENVDRLDDEFDNAVLECALKADADYVITGDSDILELGNFRGIETATPAEFVDEFPDKR